MKRNVALGVCFVAGLLIGSIATNRISVSNARYAAQRRGEVAALLNSTWHYVSVARLWRDGNTKDTEQLLEMLISEGVRDIEHTGIEYAEPDNLTRTMEHVAEYYEQHPYAGEMRSSEAIALVRSLGNEGHKNSR